MSLHVAMSGWLLGQPSGANRRLLALLRAVGPQLAPGERVTVLCRPDFAPPALSGIGWQPVAIPTGPTLRRAFVERRTLRATLRRLDVDVLDHGFLPLPTVDAPVCLLVHDLRAVDGLTRWPRALARAVLRRACARAAAVVTPSRWTAARLQQLAPRMPAAVVVPNAVAPPPASQGALPAPLPPHGFVLHVGHVEARKNLAVLAAALQRLPATARPELWLAGRDAGALADVRATAGDAIVRALGVVDDATLAALYAHARCVAVPSRHEGFGMTALEAFAHGAPVIASACAALPEIVGTHGVLLPPDDVAAWAAALAATRRDDGCGAARRAHAMAHDWTASAAALLATWRRLGAR